MKGKRIVITRAPHQAEELARLLRQRGAEALLYPCIALAPPEDTTLLDASILAAADGAFDWLVLTSANAVQILAQRLKEQDIPAQRLANLELACVGPATAEAVTKLLGLNVRTIPETYVAEALATALQKYLPARVLLLQADIARPVLRQKLRELGATVRAVPAYRTVRGSGGVPLPALLAGHKIDAITFTSASTVQYCVRRLEVEGGDTASLAEVCLACIGPITSRALQALGYSATVEPAEHTLEGLVAALEAYFQQQKDAISR
jgi:uroporphyrinogen-III synthase